MKRSTLIIIGILSILLIVIIIGFIVKRNNESINEKSISKKIYIDSNCKISDCLLLKSVE